jgi:hypothetical protein
MLYENMGIRQFKHLWILGENATGTVDQSDMVVSIYLVGRSGTALQGIEENIDIGGSLSWMPRSFWIIKIGILEERSV